jgi:hypothetical protein
VINKGLTASPFPTAIFSTCIHGYEKPNSPQKRHQCIANASVHQKVVLQYGYYKKNSPRKNAPVHCKCKPLPVCSIYSITKE